MDYSIEGNLVDVRNKKIYFGKLSVKAGKIAAKIELAAENKEMPYIMPGFIDAHVHIESSMLVPSEFAKLAVVHGTVATVSDPHEIANVCGMEGVKFMIENGKTVPFKFHFGAPSCVPATAFETAGASLSPAEVKELLEMEDIFYLSEMMNFPGVLNSDPAVMEKLNAAKKIGKPVDGHAPGLRGGDAKKYIFANSNEVVISTDHECFTMEEAVDKLKHGMMVIIREGSAAKNFDALIELLAGHSENIMFCSDDKHPDSLVAGHINELCQRAVAKNIPVFNVLLAACINPVEHYKLNVGLLETGDPADFIIVEDLENFRVQQTFIDGVEVARHGETRIETSKAEPLNNFQCNEIHESDIAMPAESDRHHLYVIEALDGQLITNKLEVTPTIEEDFFVSDIERDILKIVVVNRYKPGKPACGFIKNFGLKQGAIASSVAHDSHNIIAVGADDKSVVKAVNLVVQKAGGISCVSGGDKLSRILALPVAGLMSNEDGYIVAQSYIALDKAAKELGSKLSSPFMTLSFMALLVIPHFKISDRGLFDADNFTLIQ